MSPPETASNGSGFQRGFLLQKPTTKAKSQLRPKSKSTSAPDSSIPAKSTEKPVRHNETSAEKDTPKPQASKKKDSGWATGFLNSKQERKPTATEKSRNVIGSKKPKTSVKTDSGWSKGFLTNNNTNKKGKKTKDGTKRNGPAKLDASETERGQSQSQSRSVNEKNTQASSNVLLSISGDDDGDFQYKNVGKLISPTNIAPTTEPTNTDRSPLISVIFDESANEKVSSLTGIEEVDFQEHSTKNRLEGNTEGTSTDFATKSLITPLISIRKNDEDCDEEEESPIFLKEVSTTRILKHKEGESAELGDGTEEKTSSQLKRNPVSTTSSSDVPTKGDTQGPNMVSSRKDNRDSNCKSILEIQLQLESLFSGSTKTNDFEAKIQSQLRTLEHRRSAWIYLLQQRQQQQPNRRTQRLKNATEQNECDHRIRALFHIEFWSDNDGTIDSEIGLESILVRLETEFERRMALESVLMIQEYFVFQRKEQERDRQSEVQQSSKKKAKTIERVTRLFIRVANLALEKRRTLLAQTAWETAILMSCFCIRKSSELQQPEIGVATTTLRETLDSLLQQQLAWQKSKTKQNEGKIDQLQEIRADSNNILKGLVCTHPEVPNLVTRLEKLIGM